LPRDFRAKTTVNGGFTGSQETSSLVGKKLPRHPCKMGDD
jgi:hypothetical protein